MTRDNYLVPMKFFRFLAGLLFVFSMTWLSGCDLKGCIGLDTPVQKAVNILDDAIDQLQNVSSDWQSVLAEAQDKLTEDAQSTIRSEIANVAARSMAQTGVEFRCDADFIKERVRQALIRIRAKILNQEVPLVEPGLCQVVPLAVDKVLVPSRINKIEFYGYDFAQGDGLKVFHEYVGGRQNVTNMIDRPTHYAMTLKFGATGVQLTERSTRIVLEQSGRVISTIAVIQPETPVCRSKVVPFTPHSITFWPPHTGRGDKDFHGNGPKVMASVSLIAEPHILKARVYMHARETKRDYTEALGEKEFDLYPAERGWRIDRVVGPLISTYNYTDSNHDPDFFNLGSGGPARRFTFVGDTKGDEAGTRTKVDIDFNKLQIEMTEIANCVSARVVQILQPKGMISDNAYQKLAPLLRQELRRLDIH